MTRIEKLEKLKQFYYRFLAEDPVDATRFDNMVMDSLDRIGEYEKTLDRIGMRS
jgi:hypothetical protein